jgi:AcrR family transcriptional regulator
MTEPATTTSGTGVRARARAEVRAAILAAAAKRVAEDGANDLSLRAVARDVGMVSSAVYRYFASRDELLTALIIEAYDSLGEHTEAHIASTRGRPAATRWVDAALAVRAWALAHRNDYALIYGTPIPGYAAPDDTTASGTRVSRALVSIVREADTSNRPASITRSMRRCPRRSPHCARRSTCRSTTPPCSRSSRDGRSCSGC